MEISDQWIISSPKRTLIDALKNFIGYRAVLFALVRRELSARYRASFFGFAWAVTKPLVQMLIYALVIGSFLGASRSVNDYALFIFVGLMVWGFISESVTSGTTSITANAGLISKAAFPREILPVASVLIAGFNFLVQIPVLILGYFFIGDFPKFSDLAMLPILMLTTFILALSLALATATINVYARDTQHLVELIMMLLMYLSPVIYSWVFAKDQLIKIFGNETLFNLYMMNPFTDIIVGFQDILWPGKRFLPDGTNAPNLVDYSSLTYWVLPLVAAVAFLVAYKFFLKHEANFAREI